MMYHFLVTVTLIASSPLFADEAVVKRCNLRVQQVDSDKLVNMAITVLDTGGGLSATVTQSVDDVTTSYNDVAETKDEKVRSDLTAQSDPEDLNAAERLVVHAMIMSEDPIFSGTYSAGFDLTLVRSTKLYVVGKTTRIGSSTIVEARDENDRVLGSFLGGLVVSPCK